MITNQKNFGKSMKENMEKIKNEILAIASSNDSDQNKLEKLNQMLAGLNPLENSREMFLVCDAAIILANKMGKTEMIAQLFLLKAKAEIAKETFLIHEMKNLTLALGWFGFARKSEKSRYDQLEARVQEIWSNTQKYIDTGFAYLNKNPYIGPAGYCQKMAGEIYASFYLQLKLYHFTSGRPWRAKISKYKLVRFLDIDDLFLLNKKSRKRTREVRRDSLKCFHEAIKYYTQSKAWDFLAECYISLGLEYHSFNSPIRSKISLYKASVLIKKYKITGLNDRLKSISKMPLIGSDRD